MKTIESMGEYRCGCGQKNGKSAVWVAWHSTPFTGIKICFRKARNACHET